ncbi:MAG: hypothetical protein ACLR56_01685 [Oscillospiraceae bacterium]
MKKQRLTHRKQRLFKNSVFTGEFFISSMWLSHARARVDIALFKRRKTARMKSANIGTSSAAGCFQGKLRALNRFERYVFLFRCPLIISDEVLTTANGGF